MKIVDHTPDVRDLAIRAQAALERVLPHFAEERTDASQNLDGAARDLLGLLTELYQLRRFARLGAPHIEDLGGFGTGLDDSDAPTVMSMADGRESWDFQPWLAEKLRSAEQFIYLVCDICLVPTAAIGTYPRWRHVYRREEPAAECRRLLEGVGAYLKAMLELLDSGELQIRQLVAADVEDESAEEEMDD